MLEVSDEGTGGLFVNPSGYVHDIVAIRHIAPEKLMLLGRPSQEHSWFPGYAWTIANCGACGQHLVNPPLHPSGYVHDIVALRHTALEAMVRLGRASQGALVVSSICLDHCQLWRLQPPPGTSTHEVLSKQINSMLRLAAVLHCRLLQTTGALRRHTAQHVGSCTLAKR